jgi:SAM-dependent methyltransferase
MQNIIYNEVYKNKKYTDFELPDFKIIGDKIIKGKKILVIGVGTARDTRFLVKDNDVYGLDISEEAVKVSNRYGIKSIMFDVNKHLKFSKSTFDIVVAKDIFEHLENPIGLLKEIYKILNKDGYLVICVPNHFFLSFRLKVLFGKNLIWRTLGHDHTKLFNEWDYMHTRFFTWNGFKEFLNNGHFKIVKSFWDFGVLAHYSEPLTVLKYLKQININKYILRFLNFLYLIFNYILPPKIRSKIVSVSPSLLCASFYVWVKKK